MSNFYILAPFIIYDTYDSYVRLKVFNKDRGAVII